MRNRDGSQGTQGLTHAVVTECLAILVAVLLCYANGLHLVHKGQVYYYKVYYRYDTFWKTLIFVHVFFFLNYYTFSCSVQIFLQVLHVKGIKLTCKYNVRISVQHIGT